MATIDQLLHVYKLLSENLNKTDPGYAEWTGTLRDRDIATATGAGLFTVQEMRRKKFGKIHDKQVPPNHSASSDYKVLEVILGLIARIDALESRVNALYIDSALDFTVEDNKGTKHELP